MATITYTNGAHLTITRNKVMLHTVRYEEQPNGASDQAISTVTEQQFNALADDAKKLGGRYNAQRFIFPIEQLDAVKEIAESMWGDQVKPAPAASEEAAATETVEAAVTVKSDSAPQPELEIHLSLEQSESDLHPWQTGEAHHWFQFRVIDKDGTGMGWARRNASAHEVGRMLLRKFPEATRVEVLNEDYAILATVTDPAPACYEIRRIEADLEPARAAMHVLKASLGRMETAVWAAANEESDSHRHSANQLAAMVKGVASRPTVLKWCQADEDSADL